MTKIRRCLNCGTQTDADPCPACDLPASAAEHVLRRRLLQRFAIFLLGALAFLPAASYYPPLELDLMLIFLGVLFFGGLGLAIWLDFRARRHASLEAPKRVFFALVPVPWLLAALLFVNGHFDSSQSHDYRAAVLGRFAMPGTLRSSRLVVSSWRPGRRIERVPVSRDDYQRFREGDVAVVRMHDGLLGIPWVYGVYRE